MTNEHSISDKDRIEDGLYGKYAVYEDGDPVVGCFVLEPESDYAARRALMTYAKATDNEELAQDLREWVREIEGPERGPRV